MNVTVDFMFDKSQLVTPSQLLCFDGTVQYGKVLYRTRKGAIMIS